MFEARIEEGIFRLRWEPGVRIEYADAVEAALALATLQGINSCRYSCTPSVFVASHVRPEPG